MGFGLLFTGYLLSHGFTSGANYVLSVVGIVGAVFLFFACRKLSEYTVQFRYAGVVSPVLGVAYLFNCILQLLVTYPLDGVSVPGVLINLSRGAIVALVFAFNFYMYLGIADIARLAEVKTLAANSVRNLVFMIIYYLDLVLAMIVKPYFPKVSGILGLCGTVFGITWLFLSVWLVMSAYMRICLPGDEDMPDSQKRK